MWRPATIRSKIKLCRCLAWTTFSFNWATILKTIPMYSRTNKLEVSWKEPQPSTIEGDWPLLGWKDLVLTIRKNFWSNSTSSRLMIEQRDNKNLDGWRKNANMMLKRENTWKLTRQNRIRWSQEQMWGHGRTSGWTWPRKKEDEADERGVKWFEIPDKWSECLKS